MAQSVENISKIEIGEVDGYDTISVYCEIPSEYYEEVVNDIQSMKAHRHLFGEPYGLFGKVIKITFMDGTYDVFALREPRHVFDSNGDNYKRIIGTYYNANEFDQLINKWMEKSLNH